MKLFIFFLFVCSNAEPLYFKPQPKEISCPDLKGTCPSNSTCCLLPSEEYGCCNSPKAVCCSDRRHCCPEGTLCDLKTSSCTNSSNSQSLNIVPIISDYMIIKDVECPDSSECEDGQTCCIMLTGKYGCCPLENAVCCDDHMHCCPTGTQCDISHKTCTLGTLSIPWLKKLISRKEVAQVVKDVICPNHLQKCSDGQTCCMLPTGIYGCCPFPDAICCADEEHCCPKGTVCDPTTQYCKGQISWNVYLPPSDMDEVLCPDKESFCQEGQTCCILKSGQYSCCPIENAVCCSDNIHCCPFGTTCDVEHASCLSPQETVEWVRKVAAKPLPQQPQQNAVCCEDGVHCCKHGQTCDTVHMRCVGTKIIEQKPWTSLQSFKVEQCDANHYCNQGETCCPDGSDFMCCPFNKGECCDSKTCCQHTCFFFNMCLPSATPSLTSRARKMNLCYGGLHFCDDGFVCDENSASCIRAVEVYDYWVKAEVNNSRMGDHRQTCRGGSVGCPAGQKCCENEFRGRGCCPFENGVCCESGFECCPETTHCSHDGRCVNSDRSISLSPTTLYRTATKDDVIAVPANEKCADKSFCPTDTTCCIQTDGQYGCCQYANATCCSDKIHCCPSGYKCDVAHQRCVESKVGIVHLNWNLFTRNKAKFMP